MRDQTTAFNRKMLCNKQKEYVCLHFYGKCTQQVANTIGSFKDSQYLFNYFTS